MKMSARLQKVLLLSIVLGAFVSAASADTKVRVMAANITTGKKQSYDPGEGIRIFQGLKPDVALIQEFNYKSNSDEDIREFVDTAFGKEFSVYREGEDSDQIPNGVVTRFPIRESGEWEDAEMPNRDFAWARIDVPGEPDLWAISVHLSNKRAETRINEARALVALIKDKVPATDYVVLGGDFNTKNLSEKMIGVLKDAVAQDDSPVDSKGSWATNMTGRYPYDWVLGNAALAARMVAVEFSAETRFPHGMVFDSRLFAELERVTPIQQDDSWADGMQHKPVVKDFLLPDGCDLK